jgi:hypothetical protein
MREKVVGGAALDHSSRVLTIGAVAKRLLTFEIHN